MNLILTGARGSGKSTTLGQVVAQLDCKLGGFYTYPLREERKKVGYQVMALDTKATMTLARIGLDSAFILGGHGVDLTTIDEFIVPALRRAIASAELIVIDEIGRMQCFAADFLAVVIECLDSPTPVLATISHRRLPFLDAVRDRDDVELVEVIPQNRVALATSLAAMLRAVLPNPVP